MRAVHARPGITRSEVAATLGLSTGMASDVVAALVAGRQLREGEPVATGGRGRPTRSLWPHPDGPLVAVAAIAHETWRVEAIAVGGEVVAQLGARHDHDAEAVLGAVAGGLRELFAQFGDRIRAIAVSAPGTVAGTRLVQAANLGWQDLDLVAVRPPEAEAVRLQAGNDATYSALAELRRGAAAGTPSSLHLYIDSGIGGALVDGGQVTTGAHGMAGEVGHMPFGPAGARCRCGARGCWNVELEGAALARALGRPVPADEVSFMRSVLAAAASGAVDELRVAADAAASLGRGAAGLVNATDAGLVVLSGLAAELLAVAPDPLHRAYRAGLMSTLAAEPPPVVAGALGDRGPEIGAMESAFEPVLAHPAV
jgi:predicted NBD/HSP70 family sugar kinase